MSWSRLDPTTEGYAGEIFSCFSTYFGNLNNVVGPSVPGSPEQVDMDLDSKKNLVDIISPPGSFHKFTGMSYPSNSDVNQLHICARFEQKVGVREPNEGDEEKFVIEESTARITYLKITGERDQESGKIPAEIRHGFHFDFEWEPQPDHPVFHVQHNPRAIDIEILEQAYDIPDQGRLYDEYPDLPRIPTPPMDIAGATYFILRQHSEDVSWPDDLEGAIDGLPEFPEECFSPKPQGGRSMIPEWWYIHADGDVEHIERETTELRGSGTIRIPGDNMDD
jgi:hypothetical protein